MNISDIKKLPKIDLHLHLLGSFSRKDLWILCQKYRPELSKEEFNNIFSYEDFNDFSRAWKFKNSLIKTYDDFEFIMQGFVSELKKDNIIYIEPAIALFELKDLEPLKLLKIAYDEFKKNGIEFSFIMDLIRGDGFEELSKQYDFYKKNAKEYNIRGVGLAGNEEKHGLSDELLPIFKQAKKDGFGITIHAGEDYDVDNIEKAITQFGADRLGHGNLIRSFYSEKYYDLIVQNGVCVEVCPSTYNSFYCKGSLVKNYGYLTKGTELNDVLNSKEKYKVCINSDDRGMFGDSMCDILEKMTSTEGSNWLYYKPTGCQIDINGLIKIQQMAVDSSFATNEVKTKLHENINAYEQSLLSHNQDC